MIFAMMVGLALIMLVHWWVHLIDDVNDADYDYCEGCNKGMCMENPQSEKCERWVNENKDHESADYIEPDTRD